MRKKLTKKFSEKVQSLAITDIAILKFECNMCKEVCSDISLHLPKCSNSKISGKYLKNLKLAKSLKEDRAKNMEAALLGVLTNPIKLPQELVPPPCCQLCACTVLVSIYFFFKIK
jgi:hypothetical protein